MLPDLLSAGLAALALPTVGLPALFVVSLVSATLLPMGSEPALFAVVKANQDLLWPALATATIGNTLGGVINDAMGYGANKAFTHERQSRWFGWLQRFGPKTLLLAWLPVIGDPLCALAGWLELPFWRCVLWMAAGKALRYLSVTLILLEIPDSVWHRLLMLW